MGPYMCIATNDVPPTVSKRMSLTVQCKFLSIHYPIAIWFYAGFIHIGGKVNYKLCGYFMVFVFFVSFILEPRTLTVAILYEKQFSDSAVEKFLVDLLCPESMEAHRAWIIVGNWDCLHQKTLIFIKIWFISSIKFCFLKNCGLLHQKIPLLGKILSILVEFGWKPTILIKRL